MGCDIHPVLEKRWIDEETGETKAWVGLHCFPSMVISEVYVGGKVVATNYSHWPLAQNRDYALFAKLAGVRGDGPDPRGLPSDASELARMELDDNADLHSHSWATAREWIEACLGSERDPEKLFLEADPKDPRVKDPYKYYLDLDIETWEDEDGKPYDSPDNYRIVFAFDN